MNQPEYQRAGVYAEGEASNLKGMSEADLQKKIGSLLTKGEKIFGMGNQYMTT